jgi:hypothetical protein
VPCCRGLIYVVEQALAKAGKTLPLKTVIISIKGEKKVR